MSLVSQAIAVTVTELLKGATWAQDWVKKQPVDPILEVLRTDGPQRPFVAVFVESAKFNVEGRMTSGTDSTLEVKIYVYVAPSKITVSLDTVEFSLDQATAGLTLDSMGRMVDAAFHLDNQWVRIWNRFVPKVLNRDVHYMLVEVENGVKIPTMEICYRIQASPDPKFLLEALPEGWAMLDTALRTQGADSVKLADLFKLLILRDGDMPDYQWLMQNFGLTQAGLDATGLGPQDMASVDPDTGETPLLQAINWFASSALWPPAEGIEFRGFSYGGATVFGSIFIEGDGNLIGDLESSVPTAVGGLSLAMFLGGSGSSAPPLAQGGVSIEGAFAAYVGSLDPTVAGAITAAVSLQGVSGTVAASSAGDITKAISFSGSSSGQAVASGSIAATVGLYGAAASALVDALGSITISGQANLAGSSSSAAASASGVLTAIALLSGSAQSTAASAIGGLTAAASISGSSSASATGSGTATVAAPLQGASSTPAASASGSITAAAALAGASSTSLAGATGATTRAVALAASVTTAAATAAGTMTQGSAPAFGSASSVSYASRSVLNVAKPASTASGDYLQAHILWAGNGTTITPPSGWTQVGPTMTAIESGSTFYLNSAIFKKVAGASEAASYDWTPSVNTSTQGKISRYTGVTGTVNAFSSNWAGGTSGTPGNSNADATGITTTVNGCLLVYESFDWGDTSNNLSPPSGFTERVDVAPLIYSADAIQATAGATGTVSHVSNANNSNPRGAWLIAIK